jgi:hypothetical protein
VDVPLMLNALPAGICCPSVGEVIVRYAYTRLLLTKPISKIPTAMININGFLILIVILLSLVIHKTSIIP